MSNKKSIPEADILQENPILLDRLYKAARAYYLMQEGELLPVTKLQADIQEELAAALVAVKMIGERGPVLMPIMSGEASIGIGELKPGEIMLLKPGVKIE